ncbi:MAG: SpoIID/LytB domain-containing protein [Oscillospiraceae bacterium]
MKYSQMKHIFPCFFTIILVICMTINADASTKIYVNTGVDVLSGNLASSYAVGSGETEQLSGGTTYILTGNGMTTIDGGTSSSIDDIDVGEIGATSVNIQNDVVKIGLYYYYSTVRDSSVETCRVSNYVGSGFEFGYYDASRVFHSLGSTDETALTVMKDTNVSVSAGAVGCYHIKLSNAYSNYDDAQKAASKYSDAFPAYYSGKFYVLVGNYTSTDDAGDAMEKLDLSGQVYSASNKCIVVTKTGTTNILFEFDYGSTYSLALRPTAGSSKAVTTIAAGNASGYRYYGDFVFLRYNGKNMTVVNYVGTEDYTKGVIPYEMSASWPKEALKAQAMCARTYAAANFNQYGAYGFDMTNDTYSQVYRGTNSANSITDAAVDETKGLYVTCGGSLCTTFFFSSDGGATACSEDIWTNALPYLRGKIDPFEADLDDFPYKSWSYSYTPDQITAKLKSRGYSIGTIDSIDAEYTDVGNMSKLTFCDTDGTQISVTKGNTYSVLGLPSIHFTIEYDKNSGKYLIEGGGWGHNVGMSQWGAYSMAKVHELSYAEIICFYYTDVDLSKGVYVS